MKTLVICLIFLYGVYALNSNEIFRRGNIDFKVYWNAPTVQCHSHKIYFEDVAAKYGIIMNTGDTFRGDKMTIMYDPGFFPALLEQKGTRKLFYRNGGVPQDGNLSLHLEYFEKHVNEQIPDVDFDGVGVIDFESWRPVFRQNFGTLLPYKEVSRDLEKQTHPTWTNAQIEAEAVRRFEKAGRLFMEETLKKVIELRPKARWGYYAYPYCFNNGTPQDCGADIQKENDKIFWLWDASENYYPSLYMAKDALTTEAKMKMIKGRINEANRLRRETGQPWDKKVIAYHWYRYRDVEEFLSREDMYNSLVTLKNSGADGVIFWGSSNDVNNKEKCVKLLNYIESTLGPLLLTTL